MDIFNLAATRNSLFFIILIFKKIIYFYNYKIYMSSYVSKMNKHFGDTFQKHCF